MILRWLIAAVHLLGLGFGLAAVLVRAKTLADAKTTLDLRIAFFADNFWGLAALLWISTGLYRAFGGLEKGSSYYLNNSYFWLKMILLLAIIALEMLPMLTLLRWRRQLAQGTAPDLQSAPRLAAISYVQAGLTIVMVFTATAMTRGLDF